MTEKIKLKIHEFYSPDIDIYSWQPDGLESVRFLLEMEIGEAGDNKKDLFQVVIATPEGLRSGARGDVIAERATIVISEYSWPLLRKAIEGIVSRCQAPTFVESVLLLQRYFRWEYEDYVQVK